jgi:hypothetical protein
VVGSGVVGSSVVVGVSVVVGISVVLGVSVVVEPPVVVGVSVVWTPVVRDVSVESVVNPLVGISVDVSVVKSLVSKSSVVKSPVVRSVGNVTPDGKVNSPSQAVRAKIKMNPSTKKANFFINPSRFIIKLYTTIKKKYIKFKKCKYLYWLNKVFTVYFFINWLINGCSFILFLYIMCKEVNHEDYIY